MSDLHVTVWGGVPRAERSRSLYSWHDTNVLLNVLSMPFRQTEWPNPVLARPSLALRTWHSLATILPLSVSSLRAVRRMDRTTAKVATRTDIARADRTTAKVAQRIDE